jgi:hypothetical protein
VAKSQLPNALDRRHLVEKKVAPAQALRIAEAYLAEGRTLEAVDFLRLADAAEKLAELRRDAIAAGDVFLFRSIAASAGVVPTREEWAALAEAAAAAGRGFYAEQALRQARREKE